jgi:hypothetical protein
MVDEQHGSHSPYAFHHDGDSSVDIIQTQFIMKQEGVVYSL